MLSSPSIWSLGFWKATAERGVSTAAQAAFAFVFVDSVQVNAFTLDWPSIGGIAAGGAFFSLLKSLIVNAKTRTGPSAIDAEHVNRPIAPFTGPDSEGGTGPR